MSDVKKIATRDSFGNALVELGGNPSILATMEQMERSLEQIADGFRKTCDRNDRTTELNLRAETALLSKKLKEEDLPRDGFPS